MVGISKVVSTITKIGYKTGVVQHAPEILLGTGLISIGAGVIFACKSTLKADEIVAQFKKDRKNIEEADGIYQQQNNTEEHYPERRKDIVILYSRTCQYLLKEYAPAIGCLAIGATAILSSYHILNTRYVTSVAAYNALKAAYTNYRKRVKEEYGEEVDKLFSHGLKEVKASKDSEGNKYDHTYELTGPGSPYLTVFNEETSTCYIPSSGKYHSMSSRVNRIANTEANISFIILQQQELTKRLKLEGYLMLNDARKALGMKPIGSVVINGEKVKAGNIGWVYPTDNEGNYIGPGDGYVDFGLFKYQLEGSEDWVILDNRRDERNPDQINVKEGVIILDFNVDGDITSYLPTLLPFRGSAKNIKKEICV